MTKDNQRLLVKAILFVAAIGLLSAVTASMDEFLSQYHPVIHWGAAIAFFFGLLYLAVWIFELFDPRNK